MEIIRIAIVGATGMVGRKMIEVVGERKIDAQFIPFASERSAGKQIEICGKQEIILELNEKNIKEAKCNYALFSAGGAISKEFAPVFMESGCIVIDNSSAFRMQKDVPLVVPEVNAGDLKKHKNLISNPNCSTIQVVVPLKALDKKFKLKRVVYTTFQAVSGAGQKGYDDLMNGLKGLPPQKFIYPIADNIIPHIDDFLESGFTKEEQKMIDETKKILHREDLRICATCVRVPVSHSHSVSVNIECEKKISREAALKTLGEMPGVIVIDDPANKLYPMPINATEKDEIFVGRVREDKSAENGLAFFAVADNIRKGAATNAVQILEEFLNEHRVIHGQRSSNNNTV